MFKIHLKIYNYKKKLLKNFFNGSEAKNIPASVAGEIIGTRTHRMLKKRLTQCLHSRNLTLAAEHMPPPVEPYTRPESADNVPPLQYGDESEFWVRVVP